MGHLAERLFWRLVACADDFGNHPWSVLLVRHQLVPLLHLDAGEIRPAMDELEKAGLVNAYAHRGENFAHVVGHQDIQPSAANGRRTRRFPACPSEDADFEPDGESGGIRVDPGGSGGHNNNNNNNNNNQQQPCACAHATAAPAAAAKAARREPDGRGGHASNRHVVSAFPAEDAGLTPVDHMALLREFPEADWAAIFASVAARRQAGQTIRNPAGLCRTMAIEGFTPAAEGRKKGATVLNAKQKMVIAAVQEAKKEMRMRWGLPEACDLSSEAWKAKWPDVTAEQKSEWDRRTIAAARKARKDGSGEG